MAEARKSRRHFLTSAAALAGCAAGSQVLPDVGPAPAAPLGDAGVPPGGQVAAAAKAAAGLDGGADAGADGGAPSITAHTIAEAEKLVSVEYTPEQRELLAGSLADQIGWAVARRKVPLDLPPALRFDPLLPGMKPPAQKDGVLRPRGAARPVPKGDEELAYSSLAELSRWIEKKQLSSSRLTRVYLERLETIGPKLNCTVTLLRGPALRAAAEADKEIAAGRYRGPLHGIPYGAKDLLDTAGIPTTWGAEPYRDRLPRADATVIARLSRAGAILVAKTTLGALANGDLWFGGRTNNPWLLAEGSSGSSAGSASATAAGLVGFSIGSETLGSIVSPSMRCGTTGLRPTFGRVARTGAMTLCWSLDKLGPICRTVEDCALVLSAINGADAGDVSSVQVPFGVDLGAAPKNLTLGYVPAHFEDKDALPEDRAALEALGKLSGVKLQPMSLPDLPYVALITSLLAEAAAAFEELTLSGRVAELSNQKADAWPNTFRGARFLSAVDLVQADRLRRKVMHVMGEAMGKVDAMVTPSLSGPMLVITNYTGHPSLTLRTGFRELTKLRSDFNVTPEPPPLSPKPRVPHGITLLGHLFDEGTICRLGQALEGSLNVWRERPPLR